MTNDKLNLSTNISSFRAVIITIIAKKKEEKGKKNRKQNNQLLLYELKLSFAGHNSMVAAEHNRNRDIKPIYIDVYDTLLYSEKENFGFRCRFFFTSFNFIYLK